MTAKTGNNYICQSVSLFVIAIAWGHSRRISRRQRYRLPVGILTLPVIVPVIQVI